MESRTGLLEDLVRQALARAPGGTPLRAGDVLVGLVGRGIQSSDTGDA